MTRSATTAHETWLAAVAAEPVPQLRRKRQQVSTRTPELTGLPFERQRVQHFTKARREEARDLMKSTYERARQTRSAEDEAAHRLAAHRFEQLCHYTEKGII